jgi:hypothetical protein
MSSDEQSTSNGFMDRLHLMTEKRVLLTGKKLFKDKKKDKLEDYEPWNIKMEP